MLIKDLPEPVTASKADWLAGTSWLGFTPTGSNQNARAQCQSTIQRQFGSGYVIEYITEQFSEPNPGFENDPSYLAEREAHKELAGRLIAVHKLRTTARPLEAILGREEFTRLQDMWAQDGKRYRWSVAFPIVESFRIVGRPKAKFILGDEAYRRLYQRSSATLRELTDEERQLIAGLEIEPQAAANVWIAIEDDFEKARLSEIDRKIERAINEDLAGALEGMAEATKLNIKRRAAWVASRFIQNRTRAGTLHCDDCGFDPKTKFEGVPDKVLRSVLDVHHNNPLHEGVRVTTPNDFTLLCPTCHRVEHTRLRLAKPAS